MKLAIMQPYFLPYIGYYQLIAAVDEFVVYDNIKYTKKGWINRNRMLLNGSDATFSLPLKKDADALHIVERELAADFNRGKLLNQFKGAYARAPHFAEIFPLCERIVGYGETNLFRYIHHALARTCEHLGIRTKIRVSSTVEIDHQLKSQSKVIALCKAVGADTYINAIGGMELYSKENFRMHGVELKFIKSNPVQYPQFAQEFVPALSIIDVLMFNSRDATREFLATGIELV